MRLFKSITALSAVALAGDKFQATPTERECLSQCKRDTECQGQEISKESVPECIQNCRDICNNRKGAVISMLGRSSAKTSKAEMRKAENTAARAEHREQLKAAQPPPMIKEIHEMRDNGDEAAGAFLACLKLEKEDLGCHGSGPGEAWDCKREMLGNCIDQNDGFASYGSEEISDFVSMFEESIITAENTKDYLIRKAQQDELMQNDVEAPKEAPTLGEKYEKNDKGKIKVGFVRRKQKNNKDNIDTSEVALEHQAAAQAYLDKSKNTARPAATTAAPTTQESDDFQFSFDSFDDAEFEQVDEFEGMEEGFEGEFDFSQIQADFTGAEFVEEAEEAAEEAELESPQKKGGKGGKGHHGKHPGKGKGGKGKAHGKDHDKDGKDHDKDHDKDGHKKDGKNQGGKPALFTLTYKNKDGIDKAKQAKKTAHGHAQMKEKQQHKMTEEKFIQEMCRCRTSMEHYHVKNYLHRHGELSGWKHKEDTCKWCAYPSSKKCWQCQRHWQAAADNATNDNDRKRNQVIEMSCFLYTRNVKNGKFHPMNGKHNDPCKRDGVHDGEFNSWHTEHHEMASQFAKYHELKKN